MTEKIIGILGGMGPEATIDLYYRILRSTHAKKDQEHIKTIIFSNPKIPDRTKAILGTGVSPLPQLIDTATTLVQAGADFIIIPCNTAHYYIDELRKKINIPIIHMIDLTISYLITRYPKVQRIGLLATDGTIKSGIYNKSLKLKSIQLILPSPEKQKDVMHSIYDHIKLGDLEAGKTILEEVTNSLIESKIELLITGCTEISLVIKNGDLIIPVIDPMDVLANISVDIALNKVDIKSIYS